MKRLILPLIVVGLVGFGFSGEVKAGAKSVAALVLVASGAHGSMGTVRASADSVQFLSADITVDTDAAGTYELAELTAKNAAGSVRYCYTLDTVKVDTTRAIVGDSYVDYAFDVNGQCTTILVENGSNLLPKTP